MTIDDLIPNVSVPEGQSGAWKVSRFIVSCDEARFSLIHDAAQMSFRAVRAGVYTKLTRGGYLVMSDTSAEKRDHLRALHAATGDVLINGLGLGMFLNAVLLKPDVRSVTVVEKSDDVIRLVGPVYADPRVTIINECAFDYRPVRGASYDAAWHDIWDDICTDNLEGMKRLHRRYGRRTRWQGSWAREICERHARAA